MPSASSGEFGPSSSASTAGMPPSPPPSDDSSSTFGRGGDSPTRMRGAAGGARFTSPPPVHFPRSASTGMRRSRPRHSVSAEQAGEKVDSMDHGSSDSRATPEAEAWERHLEEEHCFGGLHWLPLVFAIVPGVGGIVHGDATGWTEGLVVCVGAFFLYHMAKVPWQIYSSSRTARLLAASRDRPFTAYAYPSPSPYATELVRIELLSLLLALVSPFFGILLLYWARGALPSSSRHGILNTTSITLYALASAVKPLGTFTELILARARYLQSRVHPPEPTLALLKDDLQALKADLALLRSSAATRQSVLDLRDELDLPLGQLSRAVRRSTRAEEGSRVAVEQRFGELEARVEEARQRVERDEEVVRRLEEENRALRLTPVATVGAVVAHLSGMTLAGDGFVARRNAGASGADGRRVVTRGRKWTDRRPFVLLFLPLNVAALVVTYVSSVLWNGGQLEIPLMEAAGESAARASLSPDSSRDGRRVRESGGPDKGKERITMEREENGKAVPE